MLASVPCNLAKKRSVCDMYTLIVLLLSHLASLVYQPFKKLEI
ncbi:hypothetical protein C1A50_3643 [Paenibacillus polymyxa]|nr:hypothetical protein C1A50_3643 [Paenibacillus polymyxa]